MPYLANRCTTGCARCEEELRSLRFKANAPVAVYLPRVDEPVPAQYRGSTLGGPVVEVPIERLARYRDQLIAAWQKTRQ
jgi:hypothetical protein